MELILSPKQIIALTIFLITYILIATGWRERTVAAFVGAGAMFLFGILERGDIFHYVDLDTFGILFGMMIIVGALRESGFFGWLGVKLLTFCRYNFGYFFLLSLFTTAILSAFLDNLTTILFMVTVSIEIGRLINVNPIPLIVGEIIISNIGGTATLVGDPPNIMIATAMNLGFMDFIYNVAPVALFCSLFTAIYLYISTPGLRKRKVEKTDILVVELGRIEDKKLFHLGIIVFMGVIITFFLHEFVGLGPVYITLTGAILIMFIGGEKIPLILRNVEWETFLFLAALFVLVGGLEKVGLLAIASQYLIIIGRDTPILLRSAILWSSGVLSAFVDNIPVAAVFIPLLSSSAANLNVDPVNLMWPLSIGAGFGGNGTIIGSSAGVVAWRVAEFQGFKISFTEFMKIGMKIMLITLAIANVYLFLVS